MPMELAGQCPQRVAARRYAHAALREQAPLRGEVADVQGGNLPKEGIW